MSKKHRDSSQKGFEKGFGLSVHKLLEQVRAGKIDTVVVCKVYRLSRFLEGFAEVMRQFTQHQVAFMSMTQHFCTTLYLRPCGTPRAEQAHELCGIRTGDDHRAYARQDDCRATQDKVNRRRRAADPRSPEQCRPTSQVCIDPMGLCPNQSPRDAHAARPPCARAISTSRGENAKTPDQGSGVLSGRANGVRTRVTAVKGQCPNH
jgi:Resolvase, N terminal domain